MPYATERVRERATSGDSLRITRKTRCSNHANEKHLNKYINYVYALCALRFISQREGQREREWESQSFTQIQNESTLVCVSCCFDTLLCDVVNFVFLVFSFWFWFSCSFSTFLYSLVQGALLLAFKRAKKMKTSWKIKHMFAHLPHSSSNQTCAFQLAFRFQVLIEFVFQFLLPPPPPPPSASPLLLLPVFM